MSNPLTIVVVGSGIGALAAAIALRRQGHKVEVCFLAQIPLKMPADKWEALRTTAAIIRRKAPWCILARTRMA